MINLPTPYDVRELADAQWLVSQLEAFCLEHGHTQEQVNAWIIQQLMNDTKDTQDND
ncbi:hypothetical protein C7964_102329 [Loktanella sp. PT4BL]|jgi:hypothetical protein|nr:hypothetical protein C7964_102329 [Loktanella sp. PT4BL]